MSLTCVFLDTQDGTSKRASSGKRGGGSIMSGCVCLNVKEMGTFVGLQMNELNEKMSFKIGVNFFSLYYG